MSRKKSDRNAPIRTTRVNIPALAVVLALILVGGPGLYLLNIVQTRRISQEALAAAARLRDAGEPDLAVRNLNQHLERNPGDINALGMKSEILASVALKSGNASLYIDAARVHELFLRVAPNDPGSQDVRRRLIELFVKYGDALKAMANTEFADLLAALDSRYRAAEMIARQHISRGATDAGARRLLAMALDGLAVPGNPAAQAQAVQEYRRVLDMDPTDIEAAERLAKIYVDRLKDPTRAALVLDDLLRANRTSVKVRLARHRFFDRLRRDREAAVELEEATKMAPDDIDVILAAAENALKRGRIDEARRQLAKVPEGLKNDVRVLLTRGLIDFGDERPDEAVDAWRQGLSTSAGTNGEVTWWLAYTLLQLGKVPESLPLIQQFARLNPGDTPLLRLLQAQYDERTGRPSRALASLDQIRQKLDPKWEGLVHLARGRCHEALWDDFKAMESYNSAMQTDPVAVVPRLAIAKLKVRRSPTEAIDLITRGLELVPGDPALRIALAGALLRQEMGQPGSRRNWSDFDKAWQAAVEAAPRSSAVALLRADRLAWSGKTEEALKFLQEVADGAPRSLPVAIALADGMTRLNRPEVALAVLDRAAVAGDSAPLRIARARTLTALFRGREARAALIRDVDKLESSDQAEIWIALGQIESARGDHEAARQAYAEWARLQPEDPRPKLVLLELALTEGNETAIKTLVQEIRLSAIDPADRGTPNSPAAVSQSSRDLAYRLSHAKELLWERDKAKPPEGSRDEQLELAGRLVDSVLEEAPTLPAASMMKAQVLERQGKIDEAVTFYEQAWGRGVGTALPRLVELLTRLGRTDSLNQLRAQNAAEGRAQVDLLSAQAFLRVGDRTQAGRIAEQVAQDLPDAREILSWQARMLSHLGKVDSAETVLRAMAERQPQLLDPWLTLIKFQAGRNNPGAIAESISRVKVEVPSERPEFIEARCLWAAGDTRGAAKAFELAQRRDPNDVSIRLEASLFHDQNNRPIEAEACLREALRIEPKNRQAARQLAVIQASRSGSDSNAWQAAWDILGPETEESNDPDERLARAVILTRAPDLGKRSQAVARLDSLIADLPSSHPSAAAARDYLTRLLLDTGQADRAARVASVSAASGTDPTAIALYAKALIQSKKQDAAEWQLERLAALNPGDQREMNLRALIKWDESRRPESAANLENSYDARESFPDAEAYGREAFKLLERQGTDVALYAERLGRKLAAKKAALSWMPALMLARASRFDDAFAMLQTGVNAAIAVEDLVETCKVAMIIATSTNDPESLRKTDLILSAAIKGSPNSDEVLTMMAMFRHIQGHFQEEADLYRKVLEHQPESIVLNQLAWVLCEGLDQPEEALKLANSWLQISGRDTNALDTRAIVYSRLGKHAEAIRDMEEVIKAAPTAQNYFHLARVYKQAGRTEDARRNRDLALQAGLTPREVDPAERDDYEVLRQL